RREDFIAGALILTIGLIGSLSNGLLLWTLSRAFKSHSFPSAFTLLCSSRCVSNIVTLFPFIAYAVPVCFIGEQYGPEILGRKFGHLTTFTYKSVVYCQLAIAFNRFIATFFTFSYDRTCGKRGVIIMLSIVWTMSALHAIPEFLPGCGYTFFYDKLSWGNVPTPCGEILSGPALFIPSFTITGICFGLNFLILFRLTSQTLRGAALGDVSKERHKRNVRNFTQSFLQELVYMFELVFLRFFVPQSRFTSLLAYTLLWEFSHTWDG
ncbi:hypothetical protein PFISCL1PPCAC_8214, partial [Pristionchus fissidentatus]